MMNGPGKNTGLLAIALGDPAGIGPEVSLKALASELDADAHRYLVIGNESLVRSLNEQLGLGLALASGSDAASARLRIFDPDPQPAARSVESRARVRRDARRILDRGRRAGSQRYRRSALDGDDGSARSRQRTWWTGTGDAGRTNIA